MSTRLVWILGLVGLALLTFGCAALHAPAIKAGLAAGTSAATAGFAAVSPTVDGRDVTLVGTVASEAERAQALAAAATVRGVRIVRDGLALAVDGGATAGAFGGLFSLVEGAGGLVVRGRVPNASVRAGVLSRLGGAFAGRAITDEMILDPAAADWQGVLQALLPVLGGVAMPDVTIDRGADGGTVVLRGRVASAEAARIETAVTRALPAPFVLRSELAAAPGDATSAADQLAASGDARLAGAEAALGEALASGRVEFDSATARLTARSREVLDRAAAVFARFPDVAADLKGYTDAEGNSRTNRVLSTRRAEATRDYLALKGVDAARLAPRGFGAADSVATNATEDGRARNRRVVFALRQN